MRRRCINSRSERRGTASRRTLRFDKRHRLTNSTTRNKREKIRAPPPRRNAKRIHASLSDVREEADESGSRICQFASREIPAKITSEGIIRLVKASSPEAFELIGTRTEALLYSG
ncbi:hypothetical protein GWI33_004976 [Rhynchophorus ferrugineus]|uniref:Uncharacterized protein n=1 Tax=Rhynchophorus ferrugineus TaxID=354439 RepID=A0A834ILB0_RHYFE|nr:hypothetical protein GWI33_004976 [Rhynchophorus ferrugineus]